MDSSIKKGFKFSLGFIATLSLVFSIVYAVGFHPASDILAGDLASGDFKITGNLNVTNNLYVGGNLSDLAENIWTIGEIGAGDLVVLAGGESVELTLSAYDNRVAGVISTAPATVFGFDKGDAPLAISGRVPVKVTNENGAIDVGDLLTSSSTPGHAMKCADSNLCFGNIVGKAMTGSSDETGEVLMLVMLG